MNKRVVVTGMGAVTPIGCDSTLFWENIKAGKNGIKEITAFDTAEFAVKIAAAIEEFDGARLDKKDLRRMDRFTQFGMTAALEAYEMAGLSAETIRSDRFATIAGSGIGGFLTIEKEHEKLLERGPRRVSPLVVPMIIGSILAGSIAIRLNATGPCHDIVTACATGTNCIGEAFRLIASGQCEAAVAGGAEAPITPLALAGFANMTALSTKNDVEHSSTPFDKDRDGFVMGEGAGMLILEELEHALARDAHIYAEVVGYGSTCDAYHITSPSPDGRGAARAMEAATREAGIAPEEVDYINAHGTGTPYNDLFETKAIQAAFGNAAEKVAISSTKGQTGHMMGAAGAAEAIVCIRAVGEDYIPPTAGLFTVDPELPLDYVQGQGRHTPVRYAMSNSLGFGGHNATLLFKKF